MERRSPDLPHSLSAAEIGWRVLLLSRFADEAVGARVRVFQVASMDTSIAMTAASTVIIALALVWQFLAITTMPPLLLGSLVALIAINLVRVAGGMAMAVVPTAAIAFLVILGLSAGVMLAFGLIPYTPTGHRC